MNKKINVSIIIGNPRAECARFGICSLEGSDDDLFPTDIKQKAAENTHRAARATLSMDHEQGLLQLEFSKAMLLPLTQQMFFSGSTFLVEVEKQLPTALCQALGMPASTYFMAGKWPIIEFEDNFTVHIEAETETFVTDYPLSLTAEQVPVI